MGTQEALQRALSGDSVALEWLVEAYQGKVYSLAYYLSRNPEEAKDLSQEAMLRVVSSIRNFKGACSFSSWVFRITNNVFIDKLRRKAKIKFCSLDEVMWEPIALDADPNEWVQRMELRSAVRSALGRLRPEYRGVIIMHSVKGMKYEEIASVLGCPVGTVKSRLNRARLALRRELGQGFSGEVLE
ncbi:MAG: RNA polymerase sigma factor [Bacillota bacterium]